MSKSKDHCMPNVTPLKPWTLKSAKFFPTVDRCDHVKAFPEEEYAKKGFNAYRDIEKENYAFTIPKESDGLASFSEKVEPSAFPDRLSVDEIDLIIRDKFVNDRYSIQELFRSSDVHKKGFITKEALMKIFCSIHENLKVEQFYKLLERYKLNKKSVVKFDDVEKAFGAPGASKFPPPVIFHGMGQPYYVSSAFGLHLLREAALDKDFDLKAILPESCFEGKCIVLMPQFREALKRIKIVLCDEDFARLWRKIDSKGVGATTLKRLLWLLNLQDNGKPMCGIRPSYTPMKRPKLKRIVRAKPALTYTNCYELSKQVMEPDLRAGDVSFPLIKVHGWKPKGPGGSDEYPFGKGKRFLQGLGMLSENRPEFNSVFNILSYIFEEPYQGMLVVFKGFDPKNAGVVSLDTGLNILSEYGFNIEYDNLIKFLSKNQCLDSSSNMNYKRMLDNIQIKGAGTCVNRIISQIITAQSQSSGLKSLRTMSVEEIEKELYKILHKDFMNFQNQLEKASNDPRLIYETEMKRIIENIIGFAMTKNQWKELQGQFLYKKENLNEDEDEENIKRQVDFRDFLEKFNKPTGICRYRHKSDLDKPTDWSNKRRIVSKEYYDPPRDHSALCKMVADKLKFRFHAIDKQYKSFALKLQGTLSKDILFELLNNQNCKLTLQEMDIIWAVVESQPEYSSWHYRQTLKHLMVNLYKKAEEIAIENRKKKMSAAEDPNIDVLREFQKSHKDDKAINEENCNKKISLALQTKSFNVDTDKATKTMEKMYPTMISVWVPFQKQIRQIDISGKASIELVQMRELLIKNGFVLPEDEMENLLYAFDLKKSGRFNYINFLQEFRNFNNDDDKSNLHFNRERHQLLNQKTGELLTVNQTYKAMRKSLLKQWKSLVRAFRKIDTNKNGKLDIDQLNKILINIGIRLSTDDLYHVFSGLDKNLDGKIDYMEFLERLLDVYIQLPE